MTRDAFFDHRRVPVMTSQGSVELPRLYRDVTAVMAYFRVDYRRAAEVLAQTPFAAVRFATGFAVAGLAFFDYRESPAEWTFGSGKCHPLSEPPTADHCSLQVCSATSSAR